MKTYTVKAGDTLTSIARSLNTTIELLMKLNATLIVDRNSIQVGWVLNYKTSKEVNQEQQASVATQKKTALIAKKTADALRPTTTQKNAEIKVAGKKVTRIDQGTVTILSPIPLLNIKYGKTNYWHPKRMLQKGETHVVLQIVLYGEEQYVTFNKKTYTFREVYKLSTGPKDPLKYIPNVSDATLFTVKTQRMLSDLNDKQLAIDDQTKTARPDVTTIHPVKTPEFTMQEYGRPSLQFKVKDKGTIVLEMRVISVSASYSSMIQQTKTNAGWMLNLSGDNLPTMNVNGFFLDTTGQLEFDRFMSVYNTHLRAYRDGDYYSSAICIFSHNRRQYQVLIMGFSHAQDSSAPHTRTFQMQFLVLKEENTLPSLEVTAKTAATLDLGYVSNLKDTLYNPLGIGVDKE